MGFISAALSGVKNSYKQLDRVAGGYLPGAHRPLHETIVDKGGDAVGDLWDAGKGAAEDVYDIASGDRDRRFAEDQADKERQWQEWLLTNKASLEKQGLINAGINPVLAGNPVGSSSTPHVSNPGGSFGRMGLGDLIGVAGSLMSLSKVKSEIGVNEATSARSLAEANATNASLNPKLDHIGAQIKELVARADLTDEQKKKVMPEIKAIEAAAGASTAGAVKSYSEAALNRTRNKQETMRLPQFAAEANFWREHGDAGAKAGIFGRSLSSLPYDVESRANQARKNWISSDALEKSREEILKQINDAVGSVKAFGKKYKIGRKEVR